MKFFILPFFLFFTFFSISQNLVIDGGFENCNENFECDWLKICESPDLLMEDLKQMKNISMIKKVNQAFSGEKYLGMFLGYESEFVIGRLKGTLQKDVTYKISMQVSRSKGNSLCNLPFKMLSVWLLDTIPVFPETKWEMSINSRFIPLKGEREFIDEETGWELVTGTYKAKGNEEYIFLGNFKGANLKVTRNCRPNYYYFDEISVVKIEHSKITIPLAVNEVITIDDIYFSSNKADLLAESFISLNRFAEKLKKKEDVLIEIYGHTDNIGDKESNQNLSELRAKSVYEYLIKQGVPSDKIKYFGFGETKSISDNDSEEGRKNNRRVEFKLTPIK
jgi:OOP family OmpA-OmpF porin